MIYTIEAGIPIPPTHNELIASTSPTLRAMKVGDSILVPKKHLNSVRYIAAKRVGIKMTARAVDANHSRLWRIA